MSASLQTEFTTLARARDRGTFDRSKVYEILDATPICHLGYTVENRPVVTPTCHWRIGDAVYWHGSRISRALIATEAQEVCLTVTLLDGLVLARSAFHHSANFRSAMIFGQPEPVTDNEEKCEALRLFIEQLFPERWQALREMTTKELEATTVLRLPINEASAKIRTGPPNDAEQDLEHPVWAGVVPISVLRGEPVTAPDMRMPMAPPAYTRDKPAGA